MLHTNLLVVPSLKIPIPKDVGGKTSPSTQDPSPTQKDVIACIDPNLAYGPPWAPKYSHIRSFLAQNLDQHNHLRPLGLPFSR